MSDERLARMVANGSERAFVTLYERHSQPLYRYCRSIVGNDSDAQDALQSALAAALVALRRGARDAPLRPWLFRITHNEAVSLLRRRRPPIELTAGSELGGPSALEDALARERLSLLVGDLRELGDRQRGALVMRELSGLSHAEIAVALGISVGAAKQAIFEARRALLDLAEGRAMACEQVRRMISDGDGRVLRARRVRGHLRVCAGCAAFAAAIPARRADLQALAPPLAPLAATGILGGVLGGSGSGHAAGGAGWLAAGATGKSAAAALVAKTAVGVVILTTATVGVTRVLQPAKHGGAPLTRTGTAPGGSGPRPGTTNAHAGAGAGAGLTSSSPATSVSRAPANNRTHGAQRGAKGRGGGSSKRQLSPAHRGQSSHTPVRGASRPPKQPARKSPRHEGQAVQNRKAGLPLSGRERSNRLGASKQATHGEGGVAPAAVNPSPAQPAQPIEGLREPTRSR